jgi:hypothetical protein
MAKRPYSDTEIRPETPEVLRYLERQRYDSPEWNTGSAPRSGFGARVINDPNVSTDKWDRLPSGREISEG